MQDLKVDSLAEPELPITADSALDKRIDWRYLDLRRPDRRLIFEVQTTVEQAMREFWRAEGFVEIHTPKLMGSASESGAELFKVEYFDTTAYLAQSPQFYKQMAIAGGFERVFEIGPVFRANPSFTSRHDTEFTSVDVEIAWIDSHEDVMAFEERWLAHVLGSRQGCARRGDREHVRRRGDRPERALPADRARGREGAAARASATSPCPAPTTTSTRPASARSPRSSRPSTATSSRS